MTTQRHGVPKEKEHAMSVVTKLAALSATAALSMTLIACGASPGSGGNGRDTAQSLAAQAQYNPQAYDNLRDGGTLTTAQPEISPQWNIFQGNTTAYSQAVWNWY